MFQSLADRRHSVDVVAMATEDFDVYFARAAALYRTTTTSDEHQSSTKTRPPPLASSSPSTVLTASADLHSVPTTPRPPTAGVWSSSLRPPPRRSVSCKYPAGSRRRLSPKTCFRAENESSDDINLVEPLPTSAAPQTSDHRLLIADDSVTAARQASLNGGSSTALGPGGRRTCSSAPHSRSSSWRKARRPKDSTTWGLSGGVGSGSTGAGVSLESAVFDKLQQLKLMQVGFSRTEF